MFRRRGIHLYLAFLSEARAPGAPGRQTMGEAAEIGFLRCVQGQLGDRDAPVHWFLPPVLHDVAGGPGSQEQVPEIGERLVRGVDRVVVMGHCGAHHALLDPGDAEKDLVWAARDPWGGGTLRLYPQPAVAAFPPHPDLGRRAVLARYRASGIDTLILRCPDPVGDAYTFLRQEEDSGLRVVSLLVAGPRVVSTVKALCRRLAPSDRSFFILFDAESLRSGAAATVLGRLRRLHPSTQALPAVPTTPQAVQRQVLAALMTDVLPCTPMARFRWLSVAALSRSARRTDVRERLRAYVASGPHRPEAIPVGSVSARPRSVSSAMPGRVTLAADGIVARFRDGMLCDLAGAGPRFPLACTLAYLDTDRGIRTAVTESATSFDDGQTKGLRTVLVLGNGRITIDFWLPDSARALVVEINALYPDVPPGTRGIVPFGLAVALEPPLEHLAITSRAADGEETHHPLPTRGSRRDGALGGAAFTVAAGDALLSLAFPERNGLPARPLPWMLWPGRKQLILNPLGTFRQAETPDYEGIAERMTLTLSPGPAPACLDPAEIRGLPEPCICRLRADRAAVGEP